MHFVQASDEWYLLAGLPLPEEERYDGYIQLENGVGMLRLLITEFQHALEEYRQDAEMKAEAMEYLEECGGHHKVTIATGRLAAPFIKELAAEFMAEFPGYEVEVIDIRNDFFGERITVSGLITAQDMVAQLKDKELGNAVAIPCNMLRMGERVFLDDMTVEEVENALQVSLLIVKSSGQALLEGMLGCELEEEEEYE